MTTNLRIDEICALVLKCNEAYYFEVPDDIEVAMQHAYDLGKIVTTAREFDHCALKCDGSYYSYNGPSFDTAFDNMTTVMRILMWSFILGYSDTNFTEPERLQVEEFITQQAERILAFVSM